MKKNHVVVVGIILIVGLGCVVIGKGSKHNSSNNSQLSQTSRRAALPKEVTVTLNSSGFSPKQITITVGSAVRWKNASGGQQTVNSDTYPTNQLHKELNFGVFANNSSVVYTFTKPGTYGYHNQFHHEQEGTIVVK